MTDDVGQIVALVVGLLLAMAGLLYALGRMEQWMTGSTAGSKALPPVADAAAPEAAPVPPAPVVPGPVAAGSMAAGSVAAGSVAAGPVAPSAVSPAPPRSGSGAPGPMTSQFAVASLVGARVATVDGREGWPADLGAPPAPGGPGGNGRARHATRRSGAHAALRRGRIRRDAPRPSTPDEHIL